ncbi:MAG: ATP-dependent DNA helicase RecG, partial [Clostridia bacterium]|nr:ATP-dependent DNA helicase RecG [Clostridia bacterium]
SALAETNDGFVSAEKDLSMRGPGEFLGDRQHGVNELTALRLACSMELLKDSRSVAQMLLAQKPKDALPLIKKAKQLLSERGGIAPN